MRSVFVALLFCAAAMAQSPGGEDPGDFVRQGQALSRLGKQDDALEMYRNALQLAPDSYAANLAAGMALDLKGDYAEARKSFTKAIRSSASATQKIPALRAMAVSYAFERNCKGAEPYEKEAYGLEIDAKDFYNAGEVADELGRICIESGDLDTASKWYQTGHEAGLREPDIKPERKNLWDFRWEHAQARLAVRRGNTAEARKHVEAAQAILAKGDNPQQAQFLPYLKGYVAFYSGDYKAALAQFEEAARNDPFIQTMIAQTYEKLGDKNQATDYYRLALTFNVHNPAGAYARPLATKKLSQ